MTIKTLLFCLCLYIALVWVWAAYRYSGKDFEQFGLLWTAGGLVALLVGIVGARLFNWWRLRRARQAARPPAPAQPAPKVHEDDATLARLISEASANLAKAPGYVPRATSPLSGMPLYLLIGPEGCGKTSTFLNSGLEPKLLAGQAAGSIAVTSSAPCSLWLARNAIFAEISGRAFAGDATRWSELMKGLRGESPVPLWRRLWREPEPGLVLRGVIGFCDVKEFMTGTDAAAAERSIRIWQERLGAIGEGFGVDFPVYQVITKVDTIPYFEEFFRRLPHSEARQVLGCTLPARKSEAAADQSGAAFTEREAQRLTQTFRSLYGAMARRRVIHLSHEPDLSRRPAIYEFPRELNRIRKPLVRFLSTAFSPHPLRFGPLLRGYYLTGQREVEAAAVGLGETRINWSFVRQGGEATRVFNADATKILSAQELTKLSPRRAAATTTERLFVADLFQNVVTVHSSMPRAKRADPQVQLYRRIAFGTACAICALLCFAFCWSWLRNRDLLHAAGAAASVGSPTPGKVPSLADLQALDDLRVQADRLTTYERKGPPLGLRWGLYSGDKLTPIVRETYFRRFQQLVLNRLNEAMLARLRALPTNPGPRDPYGPTYDLLKAHLMISSGGCKAEPAFLSRVLKQTREEANIAAGPDEGTLVDHQIDFYASELPYGNPVHLEEDAAARDRARHYLQSVRGTDRIYAGILANVEKTLAKPQRLADLAPDYPRVLNGTGEVSSAFTPDGWRLVEKASKEANRGEVGESCVLGGPSSVASERVEDIELARAIQSRFINDYIGHWRNFVAGISVARYGSPEDAARKLEILAGHRSPLLAVFALTANQTNFPSGSEQQTFIENKVPTLGKILKAGKKAEASAEKAATGHANLPEASRPEDITRAFQPVDWVVPPNSETWVIDKNSAYIEAISQLSHSMDEIARTANNPDPSVHQTASQNYQKALEAVHQIAQGFKPMGVEGVDGAVQRLLEEPIAQTKPFIITDIGTEVVRKINGELRVFCSRLTPTIRKFPFRQSSDEDVSLEELAYTFAPTTGTVWKFQAQVLGDFTLKDGSQWKAKDPGKKPQVTPGMLAFLNHAQSVSDAFYPSGATQPQLTYTLRPKLDASFKDAILELDIDGRAYQWTTSLQKQFFWPAPPGTQDLGAVARVRAGALTIPVASRGGVWGIFRIMGDAEPRPLNGRMVEWKNLRGGDGRLEPIQPAPVRIEIVEFPSGHDLFNPVFFEGLQCPANAVQ